jgi:hypothetical protein
MTKELFYIDYIYTSTAKNVSTFPVSGGNKYRNLALQVEGVSKIQTINYVHDRGTQI